MVKEEQDLLLFDWKTYYNTYKDIIVRDLEIEVKNRDVAWYHWMNFGKKANLKFFKIDNFYFRTPNNFFNNILILRNIKLVIIAYLHTHIFKDLYR